MHKSKKKCWPLRSDVNGRIIYRQKPTKTDKHRQKPTNTVNNRQEADKNRQEADKMKLKLF